MSTLQFMTFSKLFRKGYWAVSALTVLIAIEGVILFNANENCLVIKVFLQHDFEVSTFTGFVVTFRTVLEHFLQKMYIRITDIVEEKRIDQACLIQGKEVAIIRMFSDNIQCQLRESFKVLLIMNEEKQLSEVVFTNREINVSIGRKLITTPLMPMITLSRQISWHTSQRWFLAWTNSITLTTWKMEDTGTSY